MTVNKITGYSAPYRSQTFRDTANSIVNRSGIISMSGAISLGVGNIIIPAFKFIQNGLIVDKNESTSVSIPLLEAPYYLTVTSPNNANIDNLIFQFAKSPLDVSTNEVIVGAYDGLEWRVSPFVSIDGIYTDIDLANIEFEKVGPVSGLLTSVGANFSVEGGVLVDKSGSRQNLQSVATFPIIVEDPDWNRVDRVIYRRPKDSAYRIGMRKYTLGGTFDDTPAAIKETQFLDSSLVRQNPKVVIASDNTAHMFVASGYGESYAIVYTKYNSDRTSIVIAATTLFTIDTPEFDVVIDKLNDIHIVYNHNNTISWRKLSGGIISAATLVSSGSTDCTNPKIATDPSNTKLFIVYQNLLGAGNSQIYFTTRTLAGALITAPKRLTSTITNQINPSVFVTDDLWVYVAWEETALARIYSNVFDDIGDSFSTPTLISGSTQIVGGGTLVDAASKPIIWVTDNKNVFIAFLQTNSGRDVISVWSQGSAFTKELLSPTEDFDKFDMYVDSTFNGVHLLLSQASQLDYVKLESQDTVISLALAVTGTSGVKTIRDIYGSLLHVWCRPFAGTWVSYSAITPILDIGPAVISGPINLAADEMAVDVASVTPNIGDKVVISGSSQGNDGTYYIQALTLATRATPDDTWVVQMTTSFVAEETGIAVGDFSYPAGNMARFIKSVSETKVLGYRYTELNTDILLARVVQPGSVILNYIPGGEPGGVDPGTYIVCGTGVNVDWGVTASNKLTISGNLKIVDLIEDLTYTLQNISLTMVEGDALYVTLDKVDFNPLPVVAPITDLPWGSPIQVLGIIKSGEFSPHLLTGEIGQLDPGEQVVLGEDLPAPLRSKLGFTSETSIQPYSYAYGFDQTDNYPTSIGNLSQIAVQNKNLRFVKAIVSWEMTTADTLEILTEGFIQVPGLSEIRNRIAPQTKVIMDGEVLYTNINRTGATAADLVLYVAAIADVVITGNTLILARRTGSDLVLECNSLKIDSGQSVSTWVEDFTAEIDQIQSDITNILSNTPKEKTLISTAGQTIFNFAPLVWDPDDAILDVEFWIDGRRQTRLTAWTKYSSNQIQTSDPVIAGKEVCAYIQGTAVNSGAGIALTTRDEGNLVELVTKEMDFVGTGVTVIRPANGKVRVSISSGGGGGSYGTKIMVSGDVATIVAGNPVSKKSDGTIVRSDSDDPDAMVFIGIAKDSIAPGMTGEVYPVGPNLADILVGLGFAPGDAIYVNEDAGTYTNDPSTLTGDSDEVLRIGFADCTGGLASSSATDLILASQLISLPS